MKFVSGKWLEENKVDREQLAEKLLQKEIENDDLKRHFVIAKLESKGYHVKVVWFDEDVFAVGDGEDNWVRLSKRLIINSDIHFILSYVEEQFKQLYDRMKTNSEMHNRLNNLLESLEDIQKEEYKRNTIGYPSHIFAGGKLQGLGIAIKGIQEILQDDEQCF